MSGINPISLYNFTPVRYNAFGEPPLSNGTKMRLIALGVNVTYIHSEKEGLIKLREAEREKANKIYNDKEKSKKTTKEDPLMDEAKYLAKKLDLTIGNTLTLNDIIIKIKNRIKEMKKAAGDDFDKNTIVNYYTRQLESLEKSQQSTINLSATMNLTANMNLAYHGIY